MKNSLRKRILSGFLAALMITTNVNTTVNASDVDYNITEESMDAASDDQELYVDESENVDDVSTAEETTDSDEEISTASNNADSDSAADDESDDLDADLADGKDASTPVDLSANASGQTEFSLTNWYYNVNGTKTALESESITENGYNTEVYNFADLDSATLNEVGFDLEFTTLKSGDGFESKSSDYLEVTLPSCLEGLTAQVDDGSYYSCAVSTDESGDSKVTISLNTIPDTEELTGTIHMSFSLTQIIQAGENSSCLFDVSKDWQTDENITKYKLVFSEDDDSANQAMTVDEENAEATVTPSVTVTPEVTAEPTTTPTTDSIVSGTFNVTGEIVFNENLNGTNWSSVVRPSTFDQPIKITYTYTDSTGKNQTVTVKAQEDNSKDNFYLKFTHDGNGGGSFNIQNLPKSVTDSKGNEYQITSYSINVEPKYAYYGSENAITINADDIKKSDFKTATGTLTLSLKSQTLKIAPAVIPTNSSDTTQFSTNVTFTNTLINDSENRTLTATYKPTANNPVSISVPVGISYSLTQKATDGYRFDNTYSTTIGSSEEPTKSENSATGTIAEGSDVTVSTTNYNQNQVVSFDVKWIDNESTSRPTLTANNFKLQYKTANVEWKDLTKDDYASLGMESDPTFDTSQAALNIYSYKGLPAVDANGNPISYQVVVNQNPSNYVSTYTDDTENNKRTFTFEEQTTYTATIEWNDASTKENRPSIDETAKSLKLYCRVDNGTYELVEETLRNDEITKNGTWSVKISGLARYDSENHEYDYVLVMGSIDNDTVTQAPVNNYYKTYYDNASGAYGNDISLCHNGGTITEVLYNTVDFKSNKVWKDPDGTSETRPTATVTLYRYIESEAEDIDDAYNTGKAAQVVFQTTDESGTVTEHIVSYTISNAEDSNISFTSDTVKNLPGGYQFPQYDDHGRKYVYFVRESLSGDNSDDYEIQYTSATTDSDGKATTVTYKNGAPDTGTITNVRRKKEAVNITKIWQNPSGLDDIEDVSVQVQIQASADGGGTYDNLTVYSDTDNSYDVLSGDKETKAETISGFSSTVPQGEVTYYVNTYNSEGKLYDMTTAKIIETITTTGGKTWEWNSEDNTITDPSGNKYTVRTAYKETATLADGMTEYRYTQTNTITATRDYTLIKQWDNSIAEDEYIYIQSVNFKLERRSTKTNSDGSQADFEKVLNSSGTNIWTVHRDEANKTWTSVINNLPKYDDEGYEYYYRATEVNFVLTNGETKKNSDYEWSVTHYRSPDQTKAVNYKSTGGRGFVTINKIWQDNGDESSRKDVIVRIYKKEDLKKALENYNSDKTKNTEIVDLDSLKLDDTPLKYYKTTLSKDSQYTTYVNYADIDKSILGDDAAKDSNLTAKDYVIIETQVGDDSDGATQAQYTYAQLYAAATGTNGYNISGTVENNNRKYDTSAVMTNGDSTVILTNTRTGTTSIDVNKTWKDENNEEGLRAGLIEFQLYRDGEKYTNLPETVTVKGNVVSESNESGDDSTSSEPDTTGTASCRVSLDHKTGIITVSAADDDNTLPKWSFTIENLDMFSLAAVPYIYSVDEVSKTSESSDSSDDEEEADTGSSDTSGTTDTSTTSTYSYTQKKLSTNVEGDSKTQTYTFNFENTISGTTSHVAYKYWQDSGVGASNRPDLYLKLYRYLKSDAGKNKNTPKNELNSYEEYKDYKDQIWTKASENTGSEDYEEGYNWKITVEDLPAFDENGEEWVYVFTETMNNDGKTVLGTYVSSAETKWTTKSGANLSDSYEVFTNTITGYMTITGKKIWTGLSGYKTEDLPDPEIALYRTVDPEITNLQSMSDEVIEKLVAEGKITKVDTTQLTDTSAGKKTQYSFPDNKVTQDELNGGLIYNIDNTYMLPKFDSDGKRYTYLVRETISGDISSQLYNEVNSNGTLTNQFRTDINRRKITVTKTWADRDGLVDNENKYPSVTYTLYRYEKNNEENTTKEIATHTINSNEFTGTDGAARYTFDDLLVYSPTGVQYCYYITEKAINGYTITYQDEEDVEKDLQKNARIDVTSVPDDWSEENADNITNVGTINTYNNPGTVKITGDKEWNDYFNLEGLRPDKINVTLSRYTNNESGQSNKVETTTVALEVIDKENSKLTVPYIVWNYGDDASTSAKWTYTIYNLPRYAPNGMPYIYTLSEAQVNGYKKANDVSTVADEDSKSMKSLTNQFEGTYYVRKNWFDGSNKYNLRPDSVTIKLQRSTDGGTTWSDIVISKNQTGTYDKSTGKWSNGLPSVSTNSDAESIVSVKLSTANLKKNTNNNSWEYTFTNLPTQDKDGKQYTYRCVETEIGGVSISETNEDDETVKYTAGAYKCEYPTQDDSKTIIDNTLNDTSLVVTKVWQGDSDDLYESRPDSLTFVLQKKGVVATGSNSGSEGSGSSDSGSDSSGDTSTPVSNLGDWENVLKADGIPYTFTISKSDNWTKTLEDLPTVQVVKSDDGQTQTAYTLYFRAVEVHADDTKDSNGNITTYGKIAFGAQNYEDTTDYSLNSTAHKYNTEKSRNESTITNKLITDNTSKDITVNKNWKRQEGDSVSAVFELWYKTKNEEDWHSYGKKITNTLSSTKTSSEHFTWKDLPEYDKVGNKLVYKVIEKSIDGYKTVVTTNEEDTKASYATEYTFTNIELQSYTVKKIWQNTDYAEKDSSGNFTSTFKLQMKVAETTSSGDSDSNEDSVSGSTETSTSTEWRDVTADDVASYKDITLSTTRADDNTQSGTWSNLPKYTIDGKEITYRAVETKINGEDVNNNTNGSYVVTYKYGTDGTANPAFADTETTATNRMVYGFVNLSKSAAYLAPEVKDENSSLAGVKFDIYKVNNGVTESTPYVKDVKTDESGHLINTNGKYGTEEKYLIAGTYLIKETSTLDDYSLWSNGVQFTISQAATSNLTNEATDTYTGTGEHGTAWISTSGIGTTTLSLAVNYIPANGEHTFEDSCKASTSGGSTAVNVESRGVVSFTKTGEKSGSDYTALDTHDGATGESSAYFGVYTDKGCTKQIAGMIPKGTSGTDETTMILTNKNKDGDEITAADGSSIPYLRAFTDTDRVYNFTILSGTYYIKELIAPAGYKLDTTVRKMVVNKLTNTNVESTELKDVYTNNKAKIMLITEKNGVTDYKWSNTPNKVTLYKLDQFGRNVTLENGGYLELKVDGDGNTFPTGENTIRLYQNESKPATKTDGTIVLNNYITYKEGTDGKGYWTFTGLFDINKTYTLSEPAESVPDNNVIAKDISFKVDADGTITVTSSDADSKDYPLSANGNDYNNYYKSSSDNNILVMRDTSRYLKDVALEKEDSETKKSIANISFKLYKYASKDDDGNITDAKDVLEKDVYLTTDSDGKIELSKLNKDVKNLITGCSLKYGLDVGKYYFEEVEKGASDNYRLSSKIYFEIKPKKSTTEAKDYNDYAEVKYDTSDSKHILTDSSDEKTVIVENDPVTSKAKTLNLTKVDSKNSNIKLSGARFVLTYTSITHGEDGSLTGDESSSSLSSELSWNCITDTDGTLYLADKDWNIKKDDNNEVQPDISKKGYYTLKEIKAPNGYMTRTDDGSTTVVTMLTFKVDSSNNITNVKAYNGSGELVTANVTSDDNTKESISLDVTVKNEKTKVSVTKLNDIVKNTKTDNQKNLDGEVLTGATLEIYEGTTITETAKKITLSNNQSSWTWSKPDGSTGSSTSEEASSGAYLPEGTLKEDTIYTLHESKAPVGYMVADDIYFCIHGTTTQDSTVVSQLYVWTGDSVPTKVDLTETNWSKNTNIKNNSLAMVDRAVLATVDLTKKLGTDSQESTALEGVIFEIDADGDVLGTAVTNSDGKLEWKTITDKGYGSKLIFNGSNQRVTNSKVDVIGQSVILQQNASGYDLTETYAPDNAYNDGRTYHMTISVDSAENISTSFTLKAVSGDSTSGNSSGNTSGDSTSGDESSTRGDQVVSDKIALNLPYKSTVTLHKYDADEEGAKAAVPGTEFTLYRVDESDNSKNEIYKKACTVSDENGSEITKLNNTGKFTTDSNGDLKIQIPEKGTYILKETNAATGYVLDENNTFTFTLKDNSETTTSDEATTKTAFGYNEINVLKKDDTGVPNERQMGSVTLTKTDADSGEALNGVVYTLTRTDKPKDSAGGELADYLLKDSVEVTTGKSYKAKKNSEGKWKLTETKDNVKDGQIYITGLNWGTYTLTEKTELSGYKLEKNSSGGATNTYTFTVDGKNNTLEFTDKDTNTKNNVTFYKTNMVDTDAGVTEIKGLSGAVFEIYEDDGLGGYKKDENGTVIKTSFYISASAKSTDEKVTSVTTGSDGKVTIYGLPTDTSSDTADTAKTYHLVEVTAPKGYKLSQTDITFKIDRQGNVQIKNSSGEYENAETVKVSAGSSTIKSPQVTMQDEAIKIYIQKLGEDDDTKLSGAEFTLTDTCSSTSGNESCNHKLANNSDSEKITITSTNGNIMIPIERLIGGHTYTLTETKAPDGYEATAVVTFHVTTAGKIDTITSTGGYNGTSENNLCVSLDGNDNPTISIRNEKIRMTLTKVSTKNSTPLAGVKFTLTPYGTVNDGSDKSDKSSFTSPFDITGLSNVTYDSTKNTYTFTTDSNGNITFPNGLLKHSNSYLLTESATINGYYLSKEAKDGVILNVDKNGQVTVERQSKYLDINTTCPVSVTQNNGTSELTVKNSPSAEFDITKKVEGNMGDLNGTYKIKMTVYEPGNVQNETTKIAEETITLKNGEKYDSVTGDSKKQNSFGTDAIPDGATLVIKEDIGDSGYKATIKVTDKDGQEANYTSNKDGSFSIKLNSDKKLSIELINTKEATIDTGVHTEGQTPLAALALIIPAMWLAYRYRRKRRGGEVE